MNETLARIVVKSNVSLGLMKAHDRQVVLAHAAARFPLATPLAEKAVNAALRSFLAGGGAMLATDHVELRRWLVDAGWLTRDGFGRAYRLAADAPERASALLGDASADSLDAAVAARRRAFAEARRLRRERHTGAASG